MCWTALDCKMNSKVTWLCSANRYIGFIAGTTSILFITAFLMPWIKGAIGTSASLTMKQKGFGLEFDGTGKTLLAGKAVREKRSVASGLPKVQVLSAANVTHILNSLVKDYDKRLRPNYGAEAVTIRISMHVTSISAVSEVDMDFTLDMYLRQKWMDPRLQFTGTNDSLTVGIELVNQIWVPDTFFPNEKTSFFHEATTHNSFLRISPSGEVYRSMRLTVKVNCDMNLIHFPMDRQNCSFEIESYGYSKTDITYKWAGKSLSDSVTIEPNMELAQFSVGEFYKQEKTIHLATGNYSRLSAYFTFSRNLGFYLIQIYLPSSLIVIISWVSFWLSREATQARVAIGVTTVLTMTTLMTSTNSTMPKVSYIKSIDIYLGTCFIIVFASLLEYAAVGYLMKRMRMKRDVRQRKVYGAIPLTFTNSDRRLEPTTPPPEVTWTNEQTGYFHQLSSPPSRNPTFQFRGPRPSLVRKCPSSPGKGYRPVGSPLAELYTNRNASNYAPILDATGSLSPTGGNGGIGFDNGGGGPSLSHRKLSVPQAPPRRRMPSIASTDMDMLECDCETDPSYKPIRLRTTSQKQGFKPSSIDKYSRVIFPLLFVSFHIVYWTVYLNTSR